MMNAPSNITAGMVKRSWKKKVKEEKKKKKGK